MGDLNDNRTDTYMYEMGLECEVERMKLLESEEDFESFCESLRPYTILLPEEYKAIKYEGKLYGYYIHETKTFNIVNKDLVNVRNDIKEIGNADKKPFITTQIDNPCVQIFWLDDEPEITVLHSPAWGWKNSEKGDEEEYRTYQKCENIIVEYYSLQKDVFSRNTGILEANKMTDKQAIITGLGSGGFFVGIELVKAGIGSIIAADDDIFAYHNICRHVCGIHDVGRYKVDIFRERVADINPNCKVYTFRDLIQHIDPQVLDEIVWKKSIILCCTDNRHAGYICNELADKYHIPMIDAGCGARASTGEVFFYKPDSGMACYTCAYGEDVGVDHSNQNVRRKFYATEAELEKLHFQPGMSLDIELTAIFETKLAIDLLMENEEEYVPKLLPYINQCTILLNYQVDKSINPYMQLFENGEQKVLPMTWKSGSAEKNIHCSYCNTD